MKTILYDNATAEAAKEVIAAVETPHHIYGPSSLKYREICPGWESDKESDTTYADEGTLLHLKTENGDTDGLTPEQADAVSKCIRVTESLTKGAVKFLKEVRLSILNGLTFGTADLVVLRRKKNGKLHLVVTDWKFGRNGVDDAEINRQGWAYLLGAMALFPEADTGEVMFCLPRRDEVTRHAFTRGDLPRLELTVRLIIERCMLYAKTKDEGMLNPTVEGCLYCGARMKCPKAISYALTTAQRYEPLEVVDNPHSSQITDPSQMVRLLEAKRILSKMCDSIDLNAKKLAQEHGGLYGPDGTLAYELASRAGVRKLKTEKVADAVDIFRQHLSDGEILAESDISLTGVLKRIGDKAPPRGKAKLRGQVEAALAEAEVFTSGEDVTYLKRVRK